MSCGGRPVGSGRGRCGRDGRGPTLQIAKLRSEAPTRTRVGDCKNCIFCLPTRARERLKKLKLPFRLEVVEKRLEVERFGPVQLGLGRDERRVGRLEPPSAGVFARRPPGKQTGGPRRVRVAPLLFRVPFAGDKALPRPPAALVIGDGDALTHGGGSGAGSFPQRGSGCA